jgi:TatD DNase family protein
MTHYTDTHCHPTLIIQREQQKNGTQISHDTIITKAKKRGVTKIFCIATHPGESFELRSLAKTYSPYHISLGIHPCDVANLSENDLEKLEENIIDAQKNKEKLIAIGEIGIDLYHVNEPKNTDKQIYFFKKQLDLAKKHDLPVVIHTRRATELTYEILSEYNSHKKGAIHAFQENGEYAEKYIALGFFLGIGGIITYPANEYLREIVAHAPLTSLLLETDAPFLPIQSMRGKINYPDRVADIASYIATLREETEEEIAAALHKNTQQLFFT